MRTWINTGFYKQVSRTIAKPWTIDDDADVMSLVDKLIKHIDLTPIPFSWCLLAEL